MATKQTLFADRLVNVSLYGGLVRLDLGVIVGPGKPDGDKPTLNLEATHQLIMPLDAFAAAVGMQQDVLRQIAARRDEATGGPAADDAVATAAPVL